MANYSDLRPLILSKLEGITELSDVKDYYTESADGFPFATFEPSNLTNTMFTNTDNLREYAFDIIVHHPIGENNRSTVISNMCIAVDAIIKAFDEDLTIINSGGAHYVKPLPGDWGSYAGQTGAIKYARLTLVIGVEIMVV